MANNNKKALYNFMESNQFKLFDFVAEFSEFRQFDNLSRFGRQNNWGYSNYVGKNMVKFILKIMLRFVQVVF